MYLMRSELIAGIQSQHSTDSQKWRQHHCSYPIGRLAVGERSQSSEPMALQELKALNSQISVRKRPEADQRTCEYNTILSLPGIDNCTDSSSVPVSIIQMSIDQ